MRVVICGDSHIGAVYGLGYSNKSGVNSRLDDYEKTLNYIVDYAIQNNVDAFIQTGDVFDSRTPIPEHMDVFNKALRKLSMANVTSIIIMGNHDYRRSGDGFTSAITSLAARDYSNVRIILEPEVLKLSGKNDEALNVLLLPYRDRRMYDGKSTEEDSKAYQDEVLFHINECDNNFPIIAVGHNFYYDGSYNDYGGTEILVKPEIFEKCDMVTMGHYHQFKIFKRKEPIAFYIGSMEKLNFGDGKIDKFFIDYNTQTKQSKIIKAPVRNLEDIVLDLSSIGYESFYTTLMEKITDFNLEDKIVRLRVLVRDTLVNILSKADIEKILNEKKPFYISKIIIEPVILKVIKDNIILNHNDDLSLFRAFLETQTNIEKEESVNIMSEVKKIIEAKT